jgi:hypothetical protein
LGWWLNLGKEPNAELLGRYADSYFEATAVLMDRFINQKVYADEEALPILFMLAHSLELALKAAHEFRRLFLLKIRNHNIQPPKNVHDLSRLVELLKEACDTDPNRDFMTKDTENFVRKVDSFNVGAAFRYPYDTHDRPAWAEQALIPMRVLQTEISIHGSEVLFFYTQLQKEYLSACTE